MQIEEAKLICREGEDEFETDVNQIRKKYIGEKGSMGKDIKQIGRIYKWKDERVALPIVDSLYREEELKNAGDQKKGIERK